jgi:hypothetical protein
VLGQYGVIQISRSASPDRSDRSGIRARRGENVPSRFFRAAELSILNERRAAPRPSDLALADARRMDSNAP